MASRTVFDAYELFRHYLDRVGKQRTREQGWILALGLGARDPFTVDYITQRCGVLECFSSLERETVDDTLADLADCGLLNRHLSPDGVVEYSKCWALIEQIETPQSPKFGGRFTALCQAVHKSLVAGICPWCGLPVIERRRPRRPEMEE